MTGWRKDNEPGSPGTSNNVPRLRGLSIQLHLVLMVGAVILLAGTVFTVVSYSATHFLPGPRRAAVQHLSL